MRRGPHWARVSRARSGLNEGVDAVLVAGVADVDDHAEPVGADLVHDGHVVTQVLAVLVGEPDGVALKLLQHVHDRPLGLLGGAEVADHDRCAHVLGDAGRVRCLLHGRPALVLVLGGVGDGRAVSGDDGDALLAALADHFLGLLAAAEVEVLG